MELKKNTRNELLKRQEISFLVQEIKNPNFNDMKKKVSEELKKSEENIDVYSIQGKFGRDTFLVKAYIYDSKKNLDAMLQMAKTAKTRKAEALAIQEEAKKKAEEKKAAEEVSKAPAETA